MLMAEYSYEEDIAVKRQESYSEAIVSAVNILYSLNIPEDTIKAKLMEEYKLSEEEVARYLK